MSFHKKKNCMWLSEISGEEWRRQAGWGCRGTPIKTLCRMLRVPPDIWGGLLLERHRISPQRWQNVFALPFLLVRGNNFVVSLPKPSNERVGSVLQANGFVGLINQILTVERAIMTFSCAGLSGSLKLKLGAALAALVWCGYCLRGAPKVCSLETWSLVR